MIERDYYPLEEAAKMIGCSMMDLAHLGASERINIIVLTQGLTGQLVSKDRQPVYHIDHLWSGINDRFCLVYKEDLQKWEAINSPYDATVYLEKIKTADNTGNDWYLHNRLTMDCRSMYLLTSDINSLRDANSNKQPASAPNEKPLLKTDLNIPDGGEVAEMNADKALAIMAMLLSKELPKYRTGDKPRPNASAIAKDVLALAQKMFGDDNIQLTSFNKRLGKALKHFNESADKDI